MAYDFLASNPDFFSCPHRTGFDALNGTISCRFKMTTTAFTNLLRRDDENSQRNFLIDNSGGSGPLRFLIIYGSFPGVTASGAFNDGAWHTATASWKWDGSTTTTIQFWIDGISQGTNSTTASNPATNEVMYIGRSQAGTYLTGSMAEVAHWSRAASAGDVAALAAGYSPRMVMPDALVLYVPLVRSTIDLCGPTVTIGGSPTPSSHPKVIYPRRSQAKFVAASAGGGFQAAWAVRPQVIGTGIY